jgi:hypothetical protein
MKYPKDLIIRPLLPEEWEKIENKYVSEFGNRMPESPMQSIFYGVFLGEKLIGFAHLEQIFHLNAVYLEKEYRQSGFISAIFESIDEALPEGFPLLVLPDKNFSRLMKKWGARLLGKIPVWRKDY